MKKPFNIRLPLLYALSLVAGIIFATIAQYFKFSSVWGFLPAGLLIGVCIFCGIKFKKLSFAIKLFLAVIIFYIGVLYTSILIFNYSNTDVYVDNAVMIYGKVSEVGLTSKGTRYIVLTDVRFGDTEVNGKLIAYFLENAGEYCRRGYEVSLYSQPEKLSFISSGSVNYYAAKGIKYSCVVAGSLQARYAFSLFGEIAYKIEELLYSCLDGETASVALALLTGNADMISSGTISAFRGGGIAHVFAVSGLHIGVIYGVLSSLLKCTPLNRYLSAVIRIIIIFMFAGVCGFTPSSVRAAVMCTVAAVASCLHRRYDALNGVAISAVIILLINPLSLFEVGFVLSYTAVLGILFISKNLSELLAFLPTNLRGGLVAGWSAQFATVPVLLSSFGYISWAGIILNIIFIPIISGIYVVLFAVMIVCLIAPVCAPVLLNVSTIPLQFIINLIVSSGVENAVIYGNFGVWIYIPFILLTLAISDKFNIKNVYRYALVGLTAIAVLCVTLTSIYGRGSSVMFSPADEGGYALIRNSSGTILVVLPDTDGVPKHITQNADVLVVVGGDEALNQMINVDGAFDRVYLKASTAPIPPLGNYDVYFKDNFTECGIEFKYIGDHLFMSCNGVEVAFGYDEKGDEYGLIHDNCSLYMYGYENKDTVLFTNSGSYSLAYCGDLSYNFSDGKLIPKHVIPKE